MEFLDSELTEVQVSSEEKAIRFRYQGDDKILLFSGRTSQKEVTSLLRTIIREMEDK